MSWQAQTAVTLYSKQTSIKRLRLLLFLANGADATGLIDPAPNQETLAEFLDCSARTVRTYLSQIEADGELKQTRIGSGPGNASAYQITLPMPENGRSDPENNTGKAENEGAKVEGNPGNISTIEALKVEVKAEISALKVEINQLKVEIFELKGGKVEGERWKGHSFKNADDPSLIHFDPFDPKEEGTPQPPYPAELADDDFSAEELALWETAVSLATRWAKYRGTYRRLDPHKQSDADDYFRPILGLLVECDGDGERAWELLQRQAEQMVADGLTVIRAGPVVAQIRNEQQRAELPARVNGNGRTASPAEAALLEYAQLRQEFMSHE